MWLAVACATIGVIRTRLKRIVTCSWSLPTAGLTALQPPPAVAGYSPPGALGGGVVSTEPGGFGWGVDIQAGLAAGVAAVTGPCGHGAVTGPPCICAVTPVRPRGVAGSEVDARAAPRAPA